MKFNRQLAIFALLLFFCEACNSNRWDVDTQNIDLNQSFNRFELDLFERGANRITENDLTELLQKYPNFLTLYIQGVMNFGSLDKASTLNVLNDFVSNEDVRELYEEVKRKYPKGDLEEEFSQLNKSFKRFSHHFPDKVIPEVVSMIATFNYATVTDDSLLAIGLDTYLGGEYPIYDQVGIPKYKSKNFSREYIVSDALKAWCITEFETDGGKNLLEQMIFIGKVIYLVKALYPEAEQHVYFNYDKTDLEWCEKNESPIWFHFIDMEMLFATESHQIRKYLGDAPFIAGFPEGSPGRVGHWVGFQLINSFMENNTSVSLSKLMTINDANKILRESNYKPKR